MSDSYFGTTPNTNPTPVSAPPVYAGSITSMPPAAPAEPPSQGWGWNPLHWGGRTLTNFLNLSPIKGTVTSMDWAMKQVTHPISEALLAINPAYDNQRGALDALIHNPLAMGPVSGLLLDKIHPQTRAGNLAEVESSGVSPFQAVAALPVVGWRSWMNSLMEVPEAVGLGGPVSDKGDDILTGLDPTDEDYQHWARETWQGKVVTGTGDALLAWYAAPEVLAAKGAVIVSRGARGVERAARPGSGAVEARIAREKARIAAATAANEGATQAAIAEARRTAFNEARIAGNEIRVAEGREPLPLKEAPANAKVTLRDRYRSVSDFGMREFLSSERDGWSMGRWLQDPIVNRSANPRALAAALTDTTGAERALVYRYALDDPTALAALERLSPAKAHTLANADGAAGAAKGALASVVGALPPAISGDIENLGGVLRLSDDAADMAKTDPWLEAATSRDDSIKGVITSYYVPKARSVAKTREIIGGGKYNLVGYRAQEFADQVPNRPSLRVLRFVGWVGGKEPAGTLPLSGQGLAHSQEEIIAFGNDAGMSQGEIASWIDRWGKATDETARREVAEAFDERGTTLVGMGAMVGEEATQAEAALKVLNSLTAVKKAKSRKDILDAEGYMEHADDTQSFVAEWDTQLANSHPLTNLRDFRRAVDLRNKDIKALEDGFAGSAARWQALGLRKIVYPGDTVLGGFYALWKPFVLLGRIGYPGRNVGEANIASYMETGRITADPFTGFGRWTLNRSDDLKRLQNPFSKNSNRNVRKNIEPVLKGLDEEISGHVTAIGDSVIARERAAAELERLTGRKAEEAVADLERERAGHFAEADQLEYDVQKYADDAYALDIAERQAAEQVREAERELRRLPEAPRPPIPSTGSILKGEAREAQGELGAARRADLAADEAAFQQGRNAPELQEAAEGAAARTAAAEAAVPEIPAGDVAKYSEDWYRKHIGKLRGQATKLKKKMDGLPPEVAKDYQPALDRLLSDITDIEATIQGYAAQLAPLRAAQKEARAELGRAKAAQTRAEAAAKKATDPEERARLNEVADEALAAHDEARIASGVADEALARAKRDPSVAEHEGRKAFLTQKIATAKKAERRVAAQRAKLDKRREKLSQRRDKFAEKTDLRAARDRRIQALDDTIAQLREDEFFQAELAQEAQAHADDLRDRLVKTVRPPKDQTRRMVGTDPFDYRGYRVAGSFDAEHRAVSRAAASAESTNRELNRISEARKFAETRAEAKYRPTGRGTVKPGAANYFSSLTSIINKDFRTSPFLQKILREEEPADILDWLRTSPEGQRIVERMRWSDEELEDRVFRSIDVLERYVPSDALRQAALKGDVDEATVRAHLASARLAKIHGAEVEEILDLDAGWEAIVTGLNSFNQKLFHWFGTVPEDTMARFPFWNSQYVDSVRRGIDANYEHLGTLKGAEVEEAIHLIEQQAKRYADNQLKSTMFTIERKYNLAVAARFAAPFIQVTMNRFGFYGRMMLDSPVEMARTFLAYNAMETHKNEYGDDVLTVSFPGPIAKLFGIESDIDVPKHSLNLIGQGSPWWNPGFGPPVTATVAGYVRQQGGDMSPLEEKLLNEYVLSGYGAGESWTDQVLPALPGATVRLAQAYLGHGEDFNRNLSMVMSQEGYKYKAGMRDMPTLAEMRERATHLTLLKFGLRIGSPIGGGAQIANPFGEQEKYMRSLQESDPDNATALFLQKYPDHYEFMVSTMENDYQINPSGAAVKRIRQYGDVLAAMEAAGADPSVLGAVVNDPSDQGFNADAYTWQKQHGFTAGDLPIRMPQTWEEGHARKEISQGWTEYMAMKTQIDDILARRGLKSLRDQGAEDLVAVRDLFVQRMETENTSWVDDFRSSFDRGAAARNARAFAVALSNDAIQDDPSLGWTASMSDYLMLRDDIGDVLAQRNLAGGSAAFDAVSNRDLVAVWQIRTDQMKASSPAFADLFDRYFDNDNMLPMGAAA